MNMELLNLINWITAKYGENILDDPARLKPLIKGYARNVPQDERTAFGRCIEIGSYRELKNAQTENERIKVKKKLGKTLRKNTGLGLHYCTDALDLLDTAIYKTVAKSKIPQSNIRILLAKLKSIKINMKNKKLIPIITGILIVMIIAIIPIYRNAQKKPIPHRNYDNENIIDNMDNMIELQRIIRHQEELTAQIEQLRNQIEANHSPQIPQQEIPGQAELIERLNNELLIEMLATKRQGMRDITGRILVNIVPINYRNNNFKTNPERLMTIVNESLNIITYHAALYNNNINFDILLNNGNNRRYLTIQNATEAINLYQRFENPRYDFTVLVFAIDTEERSYIRRRSDYAHAIMWFREQDGYSSGTLVHEIYHAFGAEDLYYEQGVIPQEVEDNFRSLIGNSIMLSSQMSTELDPINAWLIGWNKKPEPWYAWFVDKRDTSNLEFYSR